MTYSIAIQHPPHDRQRLMTICAASLAAGIRGLSGICFNLRLIRFRQAFASPASTAAIFAPVDASRRVDHDERRFFNPRLFLKRLVFASLPAAVERVTARSYRSPETINRKAFKRPAVGIFQRNGEVHIPYAGSDQSCNVASQVGRSVKRSPR